MEGRTLILKNKANSTRESIYDPYNYDSFCLKSPTQDRLESVNPTEFLNLGNFRVFGMGRGRWTHNTSSSRLSVVRSICERTGSRIISFSGCGLCQRKRIGGAGGWCFFIYLYISLAILILQRSKMASLKKVWDGQTFSTVLGTGIIYHTWARNGIKVQ